MAASVYENIRLDTALSTNLPTATYKAIEIRDENLASVVVDRGVTGTTHVHRALTGTGGIVRHRDYRYKLLLTMAEYLAIIQDVGKVVYFMPNYRDESNYASYRKVVVLEKFEDETPLVLPTLTYYTASIILRDAEGCTVDS